MLADTFIVNKQIIVDSSRGIEVYDPQGNPVKLIEKTSADEARLVRIRNGKFAIIFELFFPFLSMQFSGLNDFETPTTYLKLL